MTLSLDDVRAAARVLDGVAHRTPVHTSRTLDGLTATEVHLKCENFQRGGSFKFRGAYNFLHSVPPDEIARGVCTVSAGNHAQAVAIAARTLGVPAAILMPQDAPEAKRQAVLGYGATVSTYDRHEIAQVDAGREFAARLGTTFVPAYDHTLVAAGAGTAMLELLETSGELDAVLVPVGGGGALAGAAVVAKALHPGTAVIGVEPAASPLARRSLEADRRVELPPSQHLADGQMLSMLGELPFQVMQEHVDRIVLVDDAQILDAMELLFDRLKLVTEPSGAIATAAAMTPGVVPAGSRVGVLVSGGNVGVRRFSDLVAAHTP